MRGDITPRLVCLSIVLVSLSSLAPPASASADLLGAPELKQASPEFGTAAWGWAYQWVELHYRQEIACVAWCYQDYEWIVLANPEPVSAPDEDGTIPGIEWHGNAWVMEDDDGIHNGVAYFSAEWIGLRYVQVATREDWQAPWRFSEPIVFQMFGGPDDDHDGATDSLEAWICNDWDYRDLAETLVDATCEDGDLRVPSTGILQVPHAPVHSGDADGDGFPETVRVTGTRVTLTPWSAWVEGMPWQDVPFDVRVGGDRPESIFRLPEEPQSAYLCMPVPFASGMGVQGDADMDGVPALVVLGGAQACFDRRSDEPLSADPAEIVQMPADPDDTQHDPATSFPLELGAVPIYASFSADADADGLPAGAQLLWARPRMGEYGELSLDLSWQKIGWDVNDSDADALVPLAALDVDQDDIPDANEPFVCLALDTPWMHDGSCDATLTDYAPPETYRSSFRAPFFLADDDGDLVLDAAEFASCHAYGRAAAIPLPVSVMPPCPVAPNAFDEAEALLAGLEG